MKIKESGLYGTLKTMERFIRGFGGFRNAYEIYYVVHGYYCALVFKKLPEELKEPWVEEFFLFINEKLRLMFYPNFTLSSNCFGGIIEEFVADRTEGILLFYRLFDEFVDYYDSKQV